MKYIVVVLLFLLFAFSSPAEAGYVLPYPSFMPGHRLYGISRTLDALKAYWYWGELGRFKYHLMLSDKYLVEAKTLFEYGQYLLAVDALTRSTDHMGFLLGEAALLKEVKQAHAKILDDLLIRVPNEFTWQPERGVPTYLPLADILRSDRTIHAE